VLSPSNVVEDVGVGLQRREPVGAQVALAAAALAALLDRRGGVPGADRLQPGGHRLELAPLDPVVAEVLGEVGHQLLLREVQPVGGGQVREQAALMRAVGHHCHLLAVGRAELAARHRVPHRDGQRDLGGVDGRAADADAALDQRAEHREEPLARALDVGVVDALLAHRGVAVEQRVAWHAHAVEPDAPVVDAIEAQLGAAVLDPDAGQHLALAGAQRHEQRVDAAFLAADDQLREHGGHAAVAGGVADPRLVRRVLGRVHLELARLGQIGRGRAQVLDVGPVALLGHREAAGQLQLRDVLEVALVVLRRPEMLDGAAEEPELHPELDEQRQVSEGHRLEAGDVAADVATAAVLDGIAGGRLPARGEVHRPFEHLLAVLLERQVGAGSVALHGQPFAHPRADLGVRPVEEPLKR